MTQKELEEQIQDLDGRLKRQVLVNEGLILRISRLEGKVETLAQIHDEELSKIEEDTKTEPVTDTEDIDGSDNSTADDF